MLQDYVAPAVANLRPVVGETPHPASPQSVARQKCILAVDLGDMQRQLGHFSAHHSVACDIDDTVLLATLAKPRPLTLIPGTQVPLLTTVEPSTAPFLRSLQERGVPVFGFTARESRWQHLTELQLHHADVDFTATNPFATATHLESDVAAAHFRGVVYSEGRRKGSFIPGMALSGVLGHLVMIDDDAEMLLSVLQTSVLCGVRFTGVLYLGAHDNADAIRTQDAWNAHKGSDAERLRQLAGI